ncbi:MAG TPA: hypothetical protein VG894_05010 [Bauldia sp.]|nr:hypothetical protein [Bauldia sp.]
MNYALRLDRQDKAVRWMSGKFGQTLVGKAKLKRPSADHARHLILAYRPGWQSLEDLNKIALHVDDIDPSIRTFIAPATARNHIVRREAARRPTLLFSPGRMPAFRPMRGKVYAGHPMAKIEEIRRLEAGGVPVPRTELLTPDILPLDPAVWGEFVIVKPTDLATSSAGRGFHLMRTHRVRYLAPAEYPAGHPGRLGPMMVQQYVDTGGKISILRVLTLFGEPLYVLLSETDGGIVDLARSDEEIEKTPIANQLFDDIKRIFVEDEEACVIARAAYRALPEVPLQGCDVIRDVTTGKLYVLETNSGGNTWHFSSSLQAESRRKNGAEFERMRRNQRDALRTAARILVARTNAEAE